MPRAKPGGFTLLEIVLALAVMALMATAIIGASAHLLSSRAVSPDDVFWQAVAASRKLALLSGADTRLGFDDKAKAFTLSNGAASKTFAVHTTDNDQLSINLLSTQGGSSAMLIAGTMIETSTMPFATFYPDGTCIPFRVQIRQRDAVHSLAIDPWTCSRVLHVADPNGTGAL